MGSSVMTVTLNPALDKTVTLSDFTIGGLNRVQQLRTDPGGKGINVAKVLKKFDVDVIATGFIAGYEGQQILRRLESEKIGVEFVNVPGETRTNLKIVDTQTSITTEINEPGFEIDSQDMEMFHRKFSTLLDESSLVVIGGSVPPGVPNHIYRDLVGMANQKGVKTILDADGIALQEGVKAKPFAIKPNIYELEKLLDQGLTTIQEIASAGQALINQGISLVMISMGSQGAIVLNHQETYQVSPFPITPNSTVGAGDSMVAVLAYSLLNKKSLAETAVWCTTAGTVTASKSGTQVCTLQEVQHFLPQVQAIRI